MEILSTTTHWGAYLFLLLMILVPAVVALFMFIGGINYIVTSGRRKSSDIVLTLLALVTFALITTVFINGIKYGPERTYKATITDFNEVYKNGYEIASHNGNLYTLRESEGK